MIVAGDRSRCYGLENLQRVKISLSERPIAMPQLPEGHHLFAIYDRLSGEQVVLCETVEDVQQLWDGYNRGGLITLAFHSTNDEVGCIGTITIPGLGQ
ncbi:MAG: hypothetical protein WAZ21_03540 [Candidatus Saccharimonadales bacterium]